MEDANENGDALPNNMDSMNTGPSNTGQRSRRALRFGLLELLLLTAAIAAWLPVWHARRQIPVLKSEIDTMLAASSRLIVMDESQLNIRALPSIWSSINSWRYFAPPNSDLELRLATEGINSVTFPIDYQSVALPEGEHEIHLKVISDAKGYHSEVFLDDDLALQIHHEPEWLDSSGSTSTADVHSESQAFPLDQTLTLQHQRFNIDHPLTKYGSVNIPSEYDKKGNYLWISPRKVVPQPPSVFLVPTTGHSTQGFGHRQGIKAVRLTNRGRTGLIGVQPSLFATLGDERRFSAYSPLTVSVRPVIDPETEPEKPEAVSPQFEPSQIGIPISFRDSIDQPKEYDANYAGQSLTDKTIRADGKSMTVFAHFKPFPSGAKPIIEILFDAEHPNRVGFLPHVATDSVPVQACQFVTQLNAKFMWRQIEMLAGPADDSSEADGDSDSISKKTTRVPLAELYPEMDLDALAENPGTTSFSYRLIPIERLPRAPSGDDSIESLLTLTTDVKDSSKIKFPAGLNWDLKYQGIANRQVWRLPVDDPVDDPDDATDDAPSGVSAEIRAASIYPTTKLGIPGGPAIRNVRITVPMPAKKPVWLEIIAEENQNAKSSPSPKK